QTQKPDQCRHTAAGQHAIINFQHEHRACEHQDVAHAADQGGAVEGTAARSKRVGEFRTNWRMTLRLTTLHRLAPDEAQRPQPSNAAPPPNFAPLLLCHERYNLSPIASETELMAVLCFNLSHPGTGDSGYSPRRNVSVVTARSMAKCGGEYPSR